MIHLSLSETVLVYAYSLYIILGGSFLLIVSYFEQKLYNQAT